MLLPGDAFGESCLLTGAPHPDDVRAGPEGVETLALTRDAAELAFVNSPGLAADVARRSACRHVLAAAATTPRRASRSIRRRRSTRDDASRTWQGQTSNARR